MTSKSSGLTNVDELSVRHPDGLAALPSAPLAIASLTAVLRDLLANGVMQFSGVMSLGDVNVSVLPPDRITVGTEEPNQLNLFMYAVAPHAVLRKSPQPAGGNRPTPTLALDLQYLVTAYGTHDYHSEILLGCAVHLLGSTPVLTRDVMRDTLQRSPTRNARTSLSPARLALDRSSIVDQEGRITLTQQFLSFEEMSKLWSVLQARYRPSVVYEVSAVCIPLAG
jgi:hypothetical protein